MVEDNVKKLELRIEKLELQDKNKNKKIEKLEKEVEILKKLNNVKKNKKKDPNAPKRYTSAFFHFNKEKIEQFKKNNPKSKVYVAQITKESKVEWDSLDTTKKKKYEDIAIKDKKRYEKEMKKYNEKENKV